ncbi:MAG TPA: TIGR03032 family protein [Gemmataceae bacterium]|nr:TIGR03032 family protein [Gemmataceae bacterium]
MGTETAPARLMADPTEQNGRDGRLSSILDPQSSILDPKPEDAGPLRAAHTPNFPALLRQLGASLLVTTYQAGKLVMVRDQGDHLNTHFRAFKAPMGLALADGGARLAIGTTLQVWEFRDNPDVARRLEPAGTHDGCFLPRSCHVTGNVQIHEMAYGQGSGVRGQGSGAGCLTPNPCPLTPELLTPDPCPLTPELWFVNTRFSCLATIDSESSFVPRWRPPFVTELEPSDRCHLNGLGMVDGKPKYVTALGETNEMHGWRANKAKGGLLMDVDSGAILCRGLSMPHSPRWYGGRLWVCESGSGTLGTVDLNTGRYEAVAAVPGFTRGLDFAGDLAFVGLSQVRESAVFSGIPITERLAPEERTCGVCVVDLRRGETVALLKFESGVQEVFAVAVLPRRFPDLINDDETLLESSFVVPTECLGEVAATVRASGPVKARKGSEVAL